jgi:2-polyprenyl-3-methyl-5-hydroxy-6-metoxy-1,4-benzoquinol methylase
MDGVTVIPHTGTVSTMQLRTKAKIAAFITFVIVLPIKPKMTRNYKLLLKSAYLAEKRL